MISGRGGDTVLAFEILVQPFSIFAVDLRFVDCRVD